MKNSGSPIAPFPRSSRLQIFLADDFGIFLDVSE